MPDAPLAAFTQNTTSGNAPLAVQFTNQSSGNITGYSWDFGDGSSLSTEKDPSHTYASVGTYTVKLKVTGPGGTSESQSTITATKPIEVPVSAFLVTPSTGTAPLNVQFTNQSTGESLTYSWDFGDGSTSTDANPTHTYATANTYTAKLTVTNSAGSNSSQQTVTVTTAPVAPVASFTANPTSGNAPLTVTFVSTSVGDFNTYAWSFTDSNGTPLGTADTANTSFLFQNAGTYTVTLTVSGLGGSDTSDPQTITVNAAPVAPVASFTADPTAGDAPLTVNFTSTSTGDGLTYAWDFGDGTTSADANPSHEYAQAGQYNVTLTVTNAGGSNTSAPQTITVNAAPVAPVASFTADPTAGDAPLTVNFTSTSTGDGLTYAWDFGDGMTSADANPSHEYAQAGQYNVTLTVTNAGGSNTSAPQTITVNVAPVAPVASFTADQTTGNAPLTVNFTSTSTGDGLTYAWDFGDGTTSADANPSHEYAQAGQYNVTLTVTNTGGSNTSAPQTITVNVAPVAPVASFTTNPTTGDAPLTVNFTSTSTGDGLTYAWDFGDGTTSADANPSHEYAQAGSYSVTLTVTNAGGSNTSAPQTITVNIAAVVPVASFTADQTTGDAPLTVNFTSTSTGDFNTYAWSFTDSNGTPLGTADTANTSFLFQNPGIYTVMLTVSGLGGSDTSDPQTITVNAALVAPVASFTADPTVGDAPLTVNFTSTSTGDGLTYIWDFGDGTTSADANPSHEYSQAGSYNVTLTVTNAGGTNTSAPQTVTVNTAVVIPVPPPINDAVVFVSNRSGNDEIYLMSTDGTLTNLTNNPASDTNPSASPDGNRIAFVSNRDGNDEIYVMNSDGSNAVRVTDNPATDTTPVWSEDGSLIVFATSRDGNYEIYAVNPDGSNPINLTNAPSNEAYPAPSPDGTRLAYMSDRDGNNDIYIQATDGSVLNISNSPTSIDASPTWSPNSSQIAFVSDREGAAQIYVANADGSNVTRISDLSRPDTRPAWSPDGTQILFVSQDNGLSQVYVMNTDGSGVAKVSDGTNNDSASSWVP
ncbi:MAG: PKD domain-containing protein [Chloroflexi bacterium]|nr:PKD domain-containing protein [Chloroflexota bacterium]